MKQSLRCAPWLLHKVMPALQNPEIRYFVIHGGRGSGKSDGIAQLMLRFSVTEYNINILCARHIQHTIAQSSKSRLEMWLRKAGLSRHFKITQSQIICRKTNSRFYFRGLSDVTKDNITSINNIKYLWIDEAHSITDEVWQRTYPSIRAPGSRIFITFNPHYNEDILYRTFVAKQHTQALVLKINYTENPWFVETPLHKMREVDEATLPTPLYHHIWEGGLREFNEMPVIYPGRFIPFTTAPAQGMWESLIISVDTAYTTKEAADYTAAGCFGKVGNNYYLLDIMRGRWEFDALYAALLDFHNDCCQHYGKVHRVLVENKASGISLIQRLRAQTHLSITECNPGTKDKFTRVCEVLDILHSSYYIPAQASWLQAYKHELMQFTADGTHEHDDQVDMTSQALKYLRTARAGTLDFNTAYLQRNRNGTAGFY